MPKRKAAAIRASTAGASNSQACSICLETLLADSRREGQLGTLLCPAKRRKQKHARHSFCFTCIRAALITGGNKCPVCRSTPQGLLREDRHGVRERHSLPLALCEVERAYQWAQHQDAQQLLEQISRELERSARQETRAAREREEQAMSAAADEAVYTATCEAVRTELASESARTLLIQHLRTLEMGGGGSRGRTRVGTPEQAG